MPNQSGNKKRKKRNEKLKTAGVLPTSAHGAVPTNEIPCASGLEASTSGDRASSSESNVHSTGGTTELSVEESTGEQENETRQVEEKKKKKKKKKKTSPTEENKIGTCATATCDSASSAEPTVMVSVGKVDENNELLQDEKKTKMDEKKTSQSEENDDGICETEIESSTDVETSVKACVGTVDEEYEIQQDQEKKNKTGQSKERDYNDCDPATMTTPNKEGAAEEREIHSEIKKDSKLEDSCDEQEDVFSSSVDTCDETAARGEVADVDDKIKPHERDDIVKERYFDRFTRLLLGVGTTCLRKYFLKIHSTWSNQPTDASALKKGVLNLQKHEQAKFYTGDINEWDVSLLIRVLRYSHVSSVELKRNPDIDNALCKISEIRNEVIAHARDKEISESDFKTSWEELKLNLVAIGGSEEEIDATLIDYTELGLEQYRQLRLEEIAQRKFIEQDSKETKPSGSSSTEEKEPLEIQPAPQWDAWLKFCDHMNSFQSSQTQFVLLADEMAQADLENFKVLAAIPWKMVIDFNPSSEDDGLYKVFNSQTRLQQVLSPLTPSEISNIGFHGLPKQIDPKRTQWLYANGRKEEVEDSKPKSFPIWEQKSVMGITMFFSCCAFSDMFDVQKSIRCLLLPMSEAVLPFIEVTLKRLIESFSRYDISITSIDNSSKNISLSKQIHMFQLSSVELHNGVRDLFNVTEDLQKYEMPSFQSGIRSSFSQKDYVYISEYLELFYIGCQDKFIDSNDEESEKSIEEEHRKLFFSGGLISFLSLYFNHDAKREIEKDIEVHIQRMLNQTLRQSGIVQIAHPPGTGGSTIAKRVLWNLHKSFPCASVRLSSQSEFDEDSNFINELCCRISILEDQCGVPPVILIDGHRQWRIHALSNRIVRTLNSRGKRAVILECHRGSKPHTNADVHKVFHVDARLEDSSADLREFKEKYQQSKQSARRVFHFPLLSMIDEFRDKLEEIVNDTLNDLDDLEKDIAAFVAFLQLYAQQPTPAILLYEVFQSRLSIRKGVQVTYQSIKECFSGSLLNLMVRQQRRETKDDSLTHYTLQHHVVATLLFNKYRENNKKTLYTYVYDFLQHNVSVIKKFVGLYCDLFLFNRGGNRKLRFSVLIDELRSCKPKEAATVFRKAAELIPDPRAYGHAARFYAKMTPPKFKDAEELIAAGIKLSESCGRVKSIQDSKGVVLSLELKHKVRKKKVKDIDNLEELAQKALAAFREARDFPPTFPSPLIGEVEVWISCIEWIIKDHSGDTDEAAKFIVCKSPPFFRTCIGDSFYLLELVDRIISSETKIADPDDIRDRAHKFRLTLMTTLRPSIVTNRRRNISDSFFGIFNNLKLPQISQKESKRIRTRILLTLYLREQQGFQNEKMKELVRLLEDMVLIEKDYSFASHFLQLCLLGNGPKTYNLDRGWKVCRDWLESPECLDPMRYYYGMVIAFMQILNGLGPSGYFAEYKSLHQKLNEQSRGHCRRNQSLHFLKKHGDGLSRLISHQALLSDQSSYNAENSDVVKSFWMVDSRRKLKECTGRLRVQVVGTKKVTKIELLEGAIELYVGKYAEIGIPGKDFDKDAKVYFVVSFNMRGPSANGITFHPSNEQNPNGAS